MAKFVQIIEYSTKQPDEMQRLGEKFNAELRSGSGPTPRVVVTADRDRPNTYMTIAEFPSYEEAMENSSRPDTTEFAKRMAELCDGPPRFYNLDVRDEM